jgi:cytochrome P450
MEGILVLATIASRWRPEALDAERVRLQATVTPWPRGAMPMRLRQRGG